MKKENKYLSMKEKVCLCIPRISSTTPKEYVKEILSSMKIGYIQKMIEIPHKNDPSQKRILINMSYEKTDESQYVQKQLSENGSVKIVHDMPWYWKIVLAN
jgi:hypothetical protein